MDANDVVMFHLREVLQAGLAEHDGDLVSRRLRAEAKIRLITMSEEELWELTRITCPPDKTFEQVYENYKMEIEKLKESSGEWMKDLEGYGSAPGGKR